MRCRIVLAASLLGLVGLGLAPTPASAATRTAVIRLTVDGQPRTYRLHGVTRSGPQALVIVLHGAGATAKEVERRYHWDPLADREGFAVAYPQAILRRWDETGTGDVDFLRTLITDVSARTPIDPARVYVTGISNGGVMTYRAGCALAGTVAAIGPVAAWFPDCLPATAVSVIHIHGLEDHVL
ncbi:MAG TPA: PHB depolymerase family esterase, partial [Acidimicrobiia bacterium]|nr:PHB depolymerase family esterase [Acidimicrobiia bacterium]